MTGDLLNTQEDSGIKPDFREPLISRTHPNINKTHTDQAGVCLSSHYTD